MTPLLAWRNLWRQPRRTLLTLLSIGFACLVTVFLLALQLGVYSTMKNNVLRIFDGYAQLQPPGFAANPSLRKTIGNPLVLAHRLQQLPGVTAVAPRAQTFTVLSHGDRSYGAAVFGVDPAAERHVSAIAHTIRRGHYLAAGEHDGIVIGSALARALRVVVGQHVTLLGSDRDGSLVADSFTVVGIFRSGDDQADRQMAQIPLSRFQDDFALGRQVNVLVVTGPSLAGVNRDLPAIRRLAEQQQVVVRDWGQLQPGLKGAIELDASTTMIWYVSLVVIVVFILLNTLLMSVFERTHEFGVLLAVGMRPQTLGRVVWLELGLLALLGAVLGMIAGSLIVLWYSRHGLTLAGAGELFAQWGMADGIYPDLNLTSLCAGPGAITICILITGIIPFRKIQRMVPVVAMRAP